MSNAELTALIRQQNLDLKRELFQTYCASCSSNLYDTCKTVMQNEFCSDIPEHHQKQLKGENKPCVSRARIANQ